MTLEQIISEIEKLPKSDEEQLRNWLADRELDAWDKQIASDSESGKLDFLTAQAYAAKKNNTLRDL